tara:strand:+ start:153 stop:623 length:471 start_codon:yes stop_codon:yes gene_type:complete
MIKRKQFLDILENEIFEGIRALNDTKGEEYSWGEDALGNFNRGGKRLGMTPEQCLGMLLDKQINAVIFYCREGYVKSESVEKRVLDGMLYLALLYAMSKDRKICVDIPKEGELKTKYMVTCAGCGGMFDSRETDFPYMCSKCFENIYGKLRERKAK